ncbi:MAG: alpha-hydroxy-acid oxidizing protein, partial [Sporichthyaceae bacterium]|nr:alpha-hydroxy-acid oxidizing protein [Sporichthyaceae bacterium]
MHWLDELEGRAAAALPEAVYAYYQQGAGRELTAAEATEAWDRLRFRPRVLRDVSAPTIATTVLGTPVQAPVLVGPTTLQRHAHPDGEIATATGAAAAGVLLGVTSNTGVPFDAIAATGAPWWLQIYLARDRGLTAELLRRAVAAGARAVVLTADTPVVGRKLGTGLGVWDLTPNEYLHANVDLTGYLEPALGKADDLSPDTIGWLAELTGLPVVVKGVLRADDARVCAAAGAAGVVVSTHGGRQLDGAVASARALPEVAKALAGTGVEVYVDGGIRRGEHVLAALALGARAVFVGRPVLWGLAADGAAGVQRVIAELADELVHAMQLIGAGSLTE